MERYLAIVAQGLVTNIIVVDPTDQVTIDHFGGLLLPEGSPVAIGWTYDGTNFAAPVEVLTLEQARAKQATKINDACQAAIVAGFTSSALGTPYSYPSNLVDQQNLAANVLSSLLPNLPANWTTLQLCATQATPPVWNYVAHTSAQIQQVGVDAKAAIMACLVKNAGLQAQIAAAPDVATIQAVTW